MVGSVPRDGLTKWLFGAPKIPPCCYRRLRAALTRQSMPDGLRAGPALMDAVAATDSPRASCSKLRAPSPFFGRATVALRSDRVGLRTGRGSSSERPHNGLSTEPGYTPLSGGTCLSREPTVHPRVGRELPKRLVRSRAGRTVRLRVYRNASLATSLRLRAGAGSAFGRLECLRVLRA